MSSALDKLAHMENLVNDKLIPERNSSETSSSDCSSSSSSMTKNKRTSRSLNVSGPVQAYHPNLKNFWYPVAFSSALKDDTMVSIYYLNFGISLEFAL